MEHLITRLKNISILFDALSNEDKANYELDVADDLEDLSELITDMELALQNFDLSHNRCTEILLEKKKDRVIANRLFPKYWEMTEHLEHMNRYLSDIDECLKNFNETV